MGDRMTKEEVLEKCIKQVRENTDFVPKVALVLGSGLGEIADRVQAECVIPYDTIEGFPVSTVPGHAGRFVLGYMEETPVVVMQGRVHYYEGYTMDEVVLPIRFMRKMGAEILFLTNAAGGVNTSFTPGTLMMIKDQITSFVPSPLLGKNVDEWGPRFPDMSEIYDLRLQDLIRAQAKDAGIDLKEGVYIQFTGPNYETPAEIRMARMLGADACGMSTTCEAMVGNHMGMEICGISCITNMAAGITDTPLSHKEVQETADRVAKQFQTLVWNCVAAMK